MANRAEARGWCRSIKTNSSHSISEAFRSAAESSRGTGKDLASHPRTKKPTVLFVVVVVVVVVVDM